MNLSTFTRTAVAAGLALALSHSPVGFAASSLGLAAFTPDYSPSFDTLTLDPGLLVSKAAQQSPTGKAAMEEPGYFDPDAWAGDHKPKHQFSYYRYQLTLDSLERGLPKSSVPLLEVVKGPGAAEVMDGLLAGLADLGVSPKTVQRQEKSEKGVFVFGDGWKLKVYGDGSRVRFRHNGLLDEHEDAQAKFQPLDPDRLVELGQSFVKKYLSKVVVLGRDEELVPFGIPYQVHAMQSTEQGSEPEEQTVAGVIVFSRKVGGVDVLGKGSKVAVLFTNEGTPFGFDVDWPALDAYSEQKVADVQEIQKRAVEVAQAEDQAQDLQLQRFECGYVDPGQRKRGAAPLQAGCFHFYTARTAAQSEDGAKGYLKLAFVDVVPAGAEIIPDENWDETLKLAYGPDAVPVRGEEPKTAASAPAGGDSSR